MSFISFISVLISKFIFFLEKVFHSILVLDFILVLKVLKLQFVLFLDFQLLLFIFQML